MNEYGDIYRSFQRVLVLQNRPEAALTIAEQGKFRAYREFLTTHLLLHPSEHPNLIIPELQDIQNLVKNTCTTVIYYSVLYDENQLDRFYRYQFSSKEPLYFSPVSLLIWVIQSTGEIQFKAIELKSFWKDNQISLAGIVRTVWEESHNQNNDLKTDNLAILYKFLIEPIEKWLPSPVNSHLTIIPQDFLYFVPFNALYSPQKGYLIDDYQISILPSLEIFQTIHQDRLIKEISPKSSILVVGNPTMPSFYLPDQPNLTLSSLPAQEEEAKAIANLFHTHAKIGSSATKAAVFNSIKNAQIIHLGTYAMLSYLEGFPCAIALAPGIQDHGWLTCQEIMKMDISAELVVISASYSRLGSFWSNGIEGLIRALILAGARQILLSLSSSSNCSTEVFLTEFYQSFLASNNAANALQQTIIKIKAKYPDPKNWAGWILT